MAREDLRLVSSEIVAFLERTSRLRRPRRNHLGGFGAVGALRSQSTLTADPPDIWWAESLTAQAALLIDGL